MRLVALAALVIALPASAGQLIFVSSDTLHSMSISGAHRRTRALQPTRYMGAYPPSLPLSAAPGHEF
jgi:hypothetical protein